MSCTVTHLHTVRDGRKIRSQMGQSWSLPVDGGSGVGHRTLADCNAAHCGLQSHIGWFYLGSVRREVMAK
ncbi:hypothetical protein PF003_g38940 [Phytophthora fragariae]|nr:hypothetical protein PF003_g38940 [Phytophthora fragariae]